MTTDPNAQQKPVPSHGGAMSAHLGLIVHVTTNHFDPYGYFSDPSHQASSTWWIGDDGRLEEYVDADLRAWAQAGGNSTYNSVETSGTPDQPMTAAQMKTLQALYAWGVHQFGWPLRLAEKPGDPGLGWHGMGGAAWGGHDGCPGNRRRAQREQIITALAHARPTTPPSKPPVAKTITDRHLGLAEPPMHGQDVQNVQHALNVDGNTVAEDGVYGQQTADLINLFNSHRGITASGCGPETWRALRAIVHGG